MRKILIVGAGQSGLQLALGLQSQGYEVTLMSNRTADEIRSGRVMSTQCMFDTALQHERDLGLNFWESQAPRIEGLGVSVAAPDAGRAIDWVGKLDGYAQSVDQRVKMAGWMETFAQRGGQLVIHGAAVGDLDYFSRNYDLVLVAAGKGELVSMFGRDASRSPYAEPQRALAVAYVHGLGPRPEHPDFDAVRCNLVPGVGELFVMPTLTTGGRADILFWEGVPGGPLDVFQGVKDPSEHLASRTSSSPTTRSPARVRTRRRSAPPPTSRRSSNTATSRSTRSGCSRPSTATGPPPSTSPSGRTRCWASRRSTS